MLVVVSVGMWFTACEQRIVSLSCSVVHCRQTLLDILDISHVCMQLMGPSMASVYVINMLLSNRLVHRV